MYHPDIQDELEHDALAYGGQALVDDIHEEAGAYVDEAYPWDGVGDEPVERVSAYLAVWWQRVDLARSELLGKTVMRADGTPMLVSPARCPFGHVLGEGQVAEGFEACRCSGHHTWTCRATALSILGDDHECGAIVYYPTQTELCWEWRVSQSDCEC